MIPAKILCRIALRTTVRNYRTVEAILPEDIPPDAVARWHVLCTKTFRCDQEICRVPIDIQSLGYRPDRTIPYIPSLWVIQKLSPHGISIKKEALTVDEP